jgi:hypothetical protein
MIPPVANMLGERLPRLLERRRHGEVGAALRGRLGAAEPEEAA